MKTVATDDQRLQRIMQEIMAGQPDAFLVGYLRPDGVTQLCVGGDVQERDQQEVAHKLLIAYALRNVAHEFGEDEADFVADGLHWLDNEDDMIEDMVESGLLPEEVLSRYQSTPDDGSDGSGFADLLADMVADADPDLPGHGEDGDDDEDGEPGGTNIPIN